MDNKIMAKTTQELKYIKASEIDWQHGKTQTHKHKDVEVFTVIQESYFQGMAHILQSK